MDPISQVYGPTFLETRIEHALNWTEQIKCVSPKNENGTGIIIKVRKSFESETLLDLYKARIFPHITYGIYVSATAAAVYLHR